MDSSAERDMICRTSWSSRGGHFYASTGVEVTQYAQMTSNFAYSPRTMATTGSHGLHRAYGGKV